MSISRSHPSTALNTPIGLTRQRSPNVLVPGKCLTAYTKLFSKLELDIHKQQTKFLREKANGKEAIEQRDRASHDLEVVMVQLAEANDALRKDTGEINSLKEQLRQQEEEDDSKG